MLIVKYIRVIFHSLFVIRNFRGACSSIEILKEYMAKESFINLNPFPSPRGSFGGISPQTKLQTPPIET